CDSHIRWGLRHTNVLVLLAGSSAFTACRVSHQTLEGQPPLPMAKKSNYQNHCGQKRNRQPQLRHRLMISPHGAAKFFVITASTVRWHGTLKSWLGSSSRYSVSVFISYLQSVHELNLLTNTRSNPMALKQRNGRPFAHSCC